MIYFVDEAECIFKYIDHKVVDIYRKEMTVHNIKL